MAGLLGAFRDWWGYTRPADTEMRASVERLIGEPSSTEFLLGAVEAESPAAGVVQMRYRHSVWTGTDDAWLEDLYVLAPARRSGLGRALTEYAMGRAGERGCARIQLDVNAGNAAAKALYESLGFSAWSEKLGADTLYMTRNLHDVRGSAHP